MQAYKGIRLMPPGWGILHQLNLEFLAPGLSREGRRVLSRHARRHRFAHLHDRGARRRRLGRRRHRSQAAVLGQPVYFLTPDVVGVHVTGALQARRDLDRSRAARDRDAAPGEGRRQVRRVLRRGRREPHAARPRDDLQHGARIRRDDRLFPGRRADLPLSARRPAARRARRARSKRTTARKAASAPRAKARSITAT